MLKEMFARITPRSTVLLTTLLVAALLVPLLAGCGGSKEAEPQAQPLVKKVDHITISCADPAALFETFTKTLGLPVAWPLSEYPGFTTAGTYAGNANIETLKFGGSGQASGGMPPFTFIYGIVFESYPLDEVTSEFQARGADPGDPQDQTREENGQQVKIWTNVTLNALCTDDYIV